ncbi:trypsin-like [Pieris napi]|uniref:trypsin-like n=1 Tax=Pieris napi TaxID=78633 RepID=UPI001FB96A5D|nr:trypsin-like [Pieris napi]
MYRIKFLIILIFRVWFIDGQARIVPEDAAPYQVSVQTIISGEFTHICGGAIISAEFVLTAAECTQGKEAEDLRILVGTNNLSSGGTTYDIDLIIEHYAYNPATLNHDLSLLRVSEDIQFNESVNQILLAEEGQEGIRCILSGWGNTDGNNGISSDTLQFIIVDILTLRQCQQELRDVAEVTEEEICAEATTDESLGSCVGDIGAPLLRFLDGKLVGIKSGTIGCNQTNPYLFASIAAEINYSWIDIETFANRRNITDYE